MEGSGDFTVEVRGLEGLRLDQESALQRVWLCGEIDARARFNFDMENEVVCEIGGEDQGSAFRRKEQRRPARTKHLRRIERAQRRNWSWTDRRQADHDHRFRIAERRRIVEP